MANPSKNTQFYKITAAKETVPASSNKTGTIETVGTSVIGTGTLFESEMQKGSWLVDLTQNEVREVMKVENDTLATLSDAFTLVIAGGTTPNVIKSDDLNIREISVAVPLVDSGGASYAFGEIDGVELESGMPIAFGKNSDTKGNFKSFIDPIIANATGTVINVTILK